MSKISTIHMELMYPFGKAQPMNGNSKIMVNKKIQINNQNSQIIKDKINAFKLLKQQTLVKLEQVIEGQASITLSYEYVPLSIQKWYLTVSREFIEHFQQRLILLSRYLVDQNIALKFRKQCLGVMDNGQGKYYLDLLFEVKQNLDKAAQKKIYKEEIKEIFQYYIDKKNDRTKGIKESSIMTPSKAIQIAEKKENTKMQKILEAIEKGKHNLLEDNRKEEQKQTLKSLKNMQNLKEMGRSGNNFKTSKTRYNEDKQQSHNLSRFDEATNKQYKSMKTSGQHYVQDFLNVLQSDQVEKILPIQTISKPKTLQEPLKVFENIQAKSPKVNQNKQIQLRCSDDWEPLNTPNGQKINTKSILGSLNLKQPSQTTIQDFNQIKPNPLNITLPHSNTLELQKKVSQAIANSLQAISRFKKAKK